MSKDDAWLMTWNFKYKI